MICIVSQSNGGFTQLPVLSVHNNTGTILIEYMACARCHMVLLTCFVTCMSDEFKIVSQVHLLVLLMCGMCEVPYS